MQGFLLFIFGILLGIKHAFDADHIVAVNTLLTKSRTLISSMKLGAFWGLGHTTTLFVIGTILLILEVSISEKLAMTFELIVGFMLIFLGIGTLHTKLEKMLRKIDGPAKSYSVGLVHGLAGSAAIMLLVLSQIDSIFQAMFYILIFGFGSILGMLIVSIALYYSFDIIPKKNYVSLIAGSLSILLGLFIIVDVGFLQGLFL